jgi:hypothetical protein
VHHALQLPEHSSCIDVAAYLQQLCQAISRSELDRKGIEPRLVERPFWMDSERCWRLGLIVSELITNAERHAFRNAGGCIRVELVPSQSFAECRVTDDGTNEGNICPGLIFPYRPLNETSCIDVEWWNFVQLEMPTSISINKRQSGCRTIGEDFRKFWFPQAYTNDSKVNQTPFHPTVISNPNVSGWNHGTLNKKYRWAPAC